MTLLTFKLPDLGEGLEEAEINDVLISEGDNVTVDQPILSVETDKAVVEVPTPVSGHVVSIKVKKGDVVPVGSVLVELSTDIVDSGTIAGDLPQDEDEVSPPMSHQERPLQKSSESSLKAAPAARALARRLGLNLESIKATGPRGVITLADVRQASSASSESSSAPLRGFRRSMAKHMTRARDQVLSATIVDDASLAAWVGRMDISARVVRALSLACQAEPSLNVSYDGTDEGYRLNKAVHIGIAVDTEEGLFVPVLRDVVGRSPESVREGLEAMKRDVQARSVSPEDLKGATISLSNVGTIAGRYATPAIVPPQVAILAIGRIRQSVLAVKDEPLVCRTLPLSLSFDHRVVTGGEAARFLGVLMEDLQKAS